MSNVLLEIGCEEIPARFMLGFLDDLKTKTQEKLSSERLTCSKIETFGTYRRLVLYIENISGKQPDLVEEIKGPPADIAFDASGKHTKAAEGFAKSQNIALDKLEVRAMGNKNYIFAKVNKKGLSAEKVLARALPQIISSLYQPLSMRWADQEFKFIRPIHYILALYGQKIIRFELAGVRSGNLTKAHRFHKLKAQKLVASEVEPSKVKTAEILLYKKLMRKLGVIVDQNERRELIKEQVEKLAKKNGLQAVDADTILDEVLYLVENPIAYMGKFDPAFLAIPQEVLVTSMKKNQKYFPLADSYGKLQAKFILISDGCKNPGIVQGNQKVLSARLADAKFFFEEDQKQPLRLRSPELEKMGYFKNLGNLAQKSERLKKLCEWLGKHLKLSPEHIESAQKAAQLCKLDLTTKMVYEFPELQGVMGREYSLLSGESRVVAQAIYEHYLPRFSEDRLPASLEGLLLAFADRLDLIVGCFSIDQVPTGSQDPYGLRRAALGMIRMILENKMDLLLDEAIAYSYKLYEPLLNLNNKSLDYNKIKTGILDFIVARIKPLLLEKEIRYDVVDAVLANYNDIFDVFEKAKSINGVVAHPDFVGIVQSADRVSRIANKVSRENTIEADLVEPEEKQLYAAYMKANWEVGEFISKEKWDDAVLGLAQLTSPLETFFDKVLVMHLDEKLKLNRLALLNALNKLYLSVADFRKVVIK